ncbi:MAG: D-glycero-alpha-D-manno-heptose-1,7-bisphosphate 7-phosphatase [Henriciella sp.]|jgi:D-glycero-D-manno-heptose 1,7-bisphosphate phosphatase
MPPGRPTPKGSCNRGPASETGAVKEIPRLLKPALFLDRDGVINLDQGYVSRVEDFEFVDGAIDCIANFKRRGWFVFVVTNQSGIAFGLYTEADMRAVHAHMQDKIEAAGTRVDRIYACPYHPDGTLPSYRRDSLDHKPGPGMLLRAMADFPVRRELSFLIGDKSTDIAAAHAAGVGGFRFGGGNLATFAEWALASFEDGMR